MGIHQALIGGYSFIANWEVLQSIGGTEFTLNGLDESNLVVFIAGKDNSTPSATGDPDATNLSTVEFTTASYINSIGYRLSYAVVPSGVTSSEVEYDCDYAFTVVLRRTPGNKSYSLSLKGFHQSNNSSPTHNFDSFNMAADSLALLIGYQDDDTLTTVSPPPSGSSGSPQNTTTLLGFDPDGDGTVCVASQKIETYGSYAWGAWTTGPGTDNCLAQVIEIKENDEWSVVQTSLGTSFSSTILKENDIVIFSYGEQFTSSVSSFPTTGFTGALSGTSLARRSGDQISANKYYLNECRYKRIASDVSNISITLPGSYGMAVVIRSSNPQAIVSPYWSLQGKGSTSVSSISDPGVSGSFAGVAGRWHVVLAYANDGLVTSFTAPSLGGNNTDLTMLGFNSSSDGACAIAINKIDTTKNYSYGDSSNRSFSVSPNSRPSVCFVEELLSYTS